MADQQSAEIMLEVLNTVQQGFREAIKELEKEIQDLETQKCRS